MMFEFLQVITFVLSIIINGNLVFMSHGFYYGSSYCNGGSSYKRSCVDYGLPIEPPFWISSGFGNPDDDRCKAYPGFEVRCEGTKPVMNISNHRYYLQEIDSNSKSITLMDADVDGEECPRPRHNFSLQSQPFLDYTHSFRLTIFYNCTIAPPPTARGVEELPCLENSYNNNKTRRSYAFQTEVDYETRRQLDYLAAYTVPEGFHDWYNYCEESVAVLGYYDDSTMNNATAGLQLQFTMSWSLPVDCDDCVYRGSGGQCSANHTTGGGLRCQCKDGYTVENTICPAPQQEAPQGTQARQ